jgi:hypothetical protein
MNKNNFKNLDKEVEGHAKYLPPVWIDIQEDIDDNLLTLRNLFIELRPLRQQRFGTKMFDDKGAQQLDMNISELIIKITTLVRKS